MVLPGQDGRVMGHHEPGGVARARGGYWWGSTIRDVCLKPWQFFCWNANDPNRKVIEGVGPNDPNFSQCLDVAGPVIFGKVPNPVEGATHYLRGVHRAPVLGAGRDAGGQSRRALLLRGRRLRGNASGDAMV
jgi:Cell Wall Hydrolase